MSKLNKHSLLRVSFVTFNVAAYTTFNTIITVGEFSNYRSVPLIYIRGVIHYQ